MVAAIPSLLAVRLERDLVSIDHQLRRRAPAAGLPQAAEVERHHCYLQGAAWGAVLPGVVAVSEAADDIHARAFREGASQGFPTLAKEHAAVPIDVLLAALATAQVTGAGDAEAQHGSAGGQVPQLGITPEIAIEMDDGERHPASSAPSAPASVRGAGPRPEYARPAPRSPGRAAARPARGPPLSVGCTPPWCSD